jgi:putative inorganic carbon (HCO3(-)) transporter
VKAQAAGEARLPGIVAWWIALDMLLWVGVPEVRRLLDWDHGFNSLPIMNLLPLLFLLPLAVLVLLDGSLARLRGSLRLLVYLWLASFGYALVVGVLGGSLLGAVYQFAQFVLPLGLGVLLATRAGSPLPVFVHLSRVTLWLGVATSFYAIYQYVSPPPWDVYWVNNSGLVTIGTPEPFGLRAFGTLNSPVTLADYLTISVLLTLPRLRISRWPLLVALVPCTVALALTFVRASWIALIVGFVVYAIFSPRRGPALAAVASVAAAVFGIFASSPALYGSSILTQQVQTRLQTFGDLEHDASAQDRQSEASVAFREARMDPFGQGLGALGTATKLGNNEAATTIDNGYLERLLEMGIIGFAGYISVTVIALAATLKLLTSGALDGETAAVVAGSLALQIALATLDLSSDHHAGLMGVAFWCCVAIVLQLCPSAEAVRSARPLGRVAIGMSG